MIVGCDNGDMIRFQLMKRQLQTFRTKSNTYRKQLIERGEKWKGGSVVTIAPTSIYPEGDEWHQGYVDDVCILGQDGDTKSPLYNKIGEFEYSVIHIMVLIVNFIVSRGSDDMEIIVWDPAKSKVKDAEIEMSLSWPDSADCTGLRFKVIEQHSML